MTTPDEPLTPQSYQAQIQALRDDFQKKIAAVQASGDFAAISALSTALQKDVMDLTERFKAAMAAGRPPAPPSRPVRPAAPPPPKPAAPVSEYDAVPQDEEAARLMLLGAMYVEENNMLGHMTRLNSPKDLAKNQRKIMTEFFCSLDMNMSDVDPAEIKGVLANSWGVESIEALTTTLAWLLKEGHHKELRQLISFCKTNATPGERTVAAYRARFDDPLAYKDMSDGGFQDLLTLAAHQEAKLSPAGIRGWDVARYVHVLRLAYMAGYMNSDQCWVHLRRLKDPVVKTFSDWKDFAHSYAMGYRWWSRTAGPIEDAVRRLLEDPQSPWAHFGWIA